jgi:hypothetical protein
MNSQPTHQQAELQLKTFDLRREAKLREAREWFFKNYFVENLDDWKRITPPGSQGSTYAMMVLTYWDQTCALLNYGLLHEDLFFETTGEFFMVWERAKATVPQGREMFKNKQFLAHLQKAAERFEEWMESRNPGSIAAMRQMMKQMQAQMAKAA